MLHVAHDSTRVEWERTVCWALLQFTVQTCLQRYAFPFLGLDSAGSDKLVRAYLYLPTQSVLRPQLTLPVSEKAAGHGGAHPGYMI